MIARKDESSLRILVVAPELPTPDRSAGYRRLFAVLEMLARRHTVDLWIENDFLGLQVEEIQRYRQLLEGAGVRLLRTGWKSFAVALGKTLYDIGFFEFYSSAETHASEFRRRQPGARVIVDSVDVHFARESGGAELGVVDAARVEETRKRELAAYRAAAAVIVVTEDDERILNAEGDMPPLFRLPIVMPSRLRVSEPRVPELVFVGGFNHLPNLDGLSWFVKGVWPRVYETVPEAHLTIIGSNTPADVQEFNSLPGVEVMGFVPDINPYLDRAAVSIAPLRYGAGMKGKVVEAMACGLPVVTTSVGAQGISALSGEHLLVADNEADFAQALVGLLQDSGRGERIGLAGQDHIAKLCGPESAERALEEMLNAMGPYRRTVRSWLHWRGFHAIFALQFVAHHLAAVVRKKLMGPRSYLMR
jgi:glycosyltransferase involved in cell wall biosynthesis